MDPNRRSTDDFRRLGKGRAMMTGYRRILVAILSLLITAHVNPSSAAQAKPEKPVVRIGYASQSGAFAQLWIGAQKNYFNAEGLNAAILFTRTVTGVQAMIAGELDFVATPGAPSCSELSARGSICASWPTLPR